jgi:hypothetical protein
VAVKVRAALAGYDPREFGGHSLRSGFVTTAGRQARGRATPWRSLATVARRWRCATTRPARRGGTRLRGWRTESYDGDQRAAKLSLAHRLVRGAAVPAP